MHYFQSGDLWSEDAEDLRQQRTVNLWREEVAIAELAPPHQGKLLDNMRNHGKASGKK